MEGIRTYWLNMLETISISASAAAIFSAEEGCGRAPPKRKDMLAVVSVERRLRGVLILQGLVGVAMREKEDAAFRSLRNRELGPAYTLRPTSSSPFPILHTLTNHSLLSSSM